MIGTEQSKKKNFFFNETEEVLHWCGKLILLLILFVQQVNTMCTLKILLLVLCAWIVYYGNPIIIDEYTIWERKHLKKKKIMTALHFAG